MKGQAQLLKPWRDLVRQEAALRNHRVLQNASACYLETQGIRILGIVRCYNCNAIGAIDSTANPRSEMLSGPLFTFNCIAISKQALAKRKRKNATKTN